MNMKRRLEHYEATLSWNGGRTVSLKYDWGSIHIFSLKHGLFADAALLFGKIEKELDAAINAMCQV
jgi:hypothetical protein